MMIQSAAASSSWKSSSMALKTSWIASSARWRISNAAPVTLLDLNVKAAAARMVEVEVDRMVVDAATALTSISVLVQLMIPTMGVVINRVYRIYQLMSVLMVDATELALKYMIRRKFWIWTLVLVGRQLVEAKTQISLHYVQLVLQQLTLQHQEETTTTMLG